MNLVTLPPWLPWWAPIAVIVPVSLYLLVFLLMPFSVFGIKSRLDLLEARLDEIQGEIRNLVLRFPPSAAADDEIDWPARVSRRDRPPIPPGRVHAADPDDLEPQDLPPPRGLRAAARPPIPEDPRRRRPPEREEPRLDWRP